MCNVKCLMLNVEWGMLHVICLMLNVEKILTMTATVYVIARRGSYEAISS